MKKQIRILQDTSCLNEGDEVAFAQENEGGSWSCWRVAILKNYNPNARVRLLQVEDRGSLVRGASNYDVVEDAAKEAELDLYTGFVI